MLLYSHLVSVAEFIQIAEGNTICNLGLFNFLIRFCETSLSSLSKSGVNGGGSLHNLTLILLQNFKEKASAEQGCSYAFLYFTHAVVYKQEL